MRSPSRTIPTALGRAALPLALVALAAGCTFPGTGPKPEDTLARLAKSMSAGNLAGVPFVEGAAAATKAFSAITKGVGEADVSAGKVTTQDDRATGMLNWRHKVGEKTWSYETRVVLRRDQGGDHAWLVDWTPKIVEPSLAQGEVLATSSIKPERGTILGAKDEPIVTLRPVLRVGLDKAMLEPSQAAASAAALARLLDVAVKDFRKQVAAAGAKAFVQGIVFRRDEVPGGVLAGLTAIPGARAISDKLPLAPSKDFGVGLLGTVGPATAELVKAGKGRIKPGDDVGISGLQKRYDEQLFGTRGSTVVAVDDKGERRTLFTADAVPGQPLRTSLDVKVQDLAQRVLAGVGPASALVAIRPSTGDILAAASGPGSKGYNTATYGRYAPGSTFKIVSALALLRGGVRPTTEVSCPATTVVDGKTFKNYSDYPSSGLGRIALRDALANSCNTAFIGQRDKVGKGGLAPAAEALGLGADRDVGFPAYFGQVQAPQSQTQAAASMIGQGSVLASPMAMATVVASVLKGGLVLPRLLPDRDAAQPTPAQPLTGAEADQLRAMMRGVVERGSGRLLQGLPGGPVIAKTGTAEFGTKPPLPTHAWMVAGRGDLAVAVFVERGDSGSGTAGPLLRRFLEQVRVP